MSSLLRERRTSSLIVSLLSILLGIILIIFKDKAVEALLTVSGILLMVLGAYYIIRYFVKKTGVAVIRIDLILGIFIFLAGLWMTASPQSVIALLQYIVGAIIVVHGIVDLQAALNIKSAGFEKWGVAFVLSLVTILLGSVIIIDPFKAISALLMLIGIVLIFDGVSDLYIIGRLSALFKAVQQEASAVETEGTVVDEEEKK